MLWDKEVWEEKNIVLLVYGKREKACDLEVTWHYVIKPRVV